MSDITPDDNKRNPFSRPGFIASVALVLVLIAAVIVIAFLPRGGDEPDAGSTEPTNGTTTSAPAPTADDTEESICGLPGNDATALGAAPENDWELVGTIVVPTDPETAGPGIEEEDGFRACFAQTPTGALFAATNLMGLGSSDDQALQLKFTQQLTVPGVGQDAALESIEGRDSLDSSGSSLQIAGFQLLSYTDEAANVDIAFRIDNGAIGHAVLPLRWVDGDWKAELADNGQLINQPSQLNDLSDYIPWSGV